MSRRRKNPHPQRAVNARTVLKTEKEEPQEGVRRLVRRILKDPPRSACSFVLRPTKDEDWCRDTSSEKFKIRERKAHHREGERENIRRMTMIPLNTNQKPEDEPPLATTTSPAVQQQKVVATTTTTTTTTTPSSLPKGGGLNQTNNQLPPVPPLPEHLKNADTETKLLYFREAKRVSIEKCRENRCGNDEVTRETHGLGEFTSGWKRPGLRECTAQEFAYDFFKFHEQRGEFDYENVWEYVLVRSRLMFFMIIYGGRHREMRSFFFARASSRWR